MMGPDPTGNASALADPIAGSPVFPAGSRVNERGRIEIGGCDLIELAAEFGTPAYVYSEDDLRARARQIVAAFAERTESFEVLYASKALSCTAAYRLFAEEGLSCDVASGGELHLALRGGFEPERIYMHGNNKTEAELQQALDAGIGHVIVDSFDEIDRLEQLAAGRRQRVLLRVTPGIRPDTHEKIATGQEDSKFGIPLAALPAAVERCEAAGLEVRGLHAHIGSQVFDLDVYERSPRSPRRRRLPRVNIGGGFAVAYTRDQSPPPAAAYAEAMLSGCPRDQGPLRARPLAGRQPRASPSTRSAPSRMSPGSAAMSPSTAAWPTTFARCSTAPATKRRSPTGSGTRPPAAWSGCTASPATS